jgi:hypothetical protein
MRFALCLGAGNLKTKQEDAMKALMLGKLAMVIVVKRTIVVSLEDRKLALIENGQVKKVYPVAVGKPSTPSPTGTFFIERRIVNPAYHHNGKTVPPGLGNPVGTRWMGLSIQGYGIHGTNEPRSIGKAASHGCIRMAKTNLEEFFELVAVGDTVELVGERNEETAQLFSDVQKPAAVAAAQPIQTAIVSPNVAPIQLNLPLTFELNGENQPAQVLMALR